MEVPEDRALIERTARGDPGAFEAFVRRWEGPLYRFLLRATRSAALAEEARQLTLVRIYTRAGGYRGGSVPVWLFRTAWTVAANLRRDEARAGAGPLPETLAAASPSPDRRAEEDEEREALRLALARLPEETRAALWLRIAEGMSLAETAAALAVPPSTLRYRLYLALRRLKRELDSPAGSGERDALP
ncbi:MAG TPA: sigma-70 family RNA polymerase sigma factor [Planctomycetota bacterium]|jgi:RNA polymerase sigma-70 factor (ECF subfamily)|nr:sigma-70 family RNA polymerase sigma factor [Planctomycetota bacterium]